MVRRFWAVGALAIVALAIGVVVGALHSPGTRRVAEQWVAAWTRGDYAAMYSMLTEESADRTSSSAFAEAYREAAETATVKRVSIGVPTHDGDDYDLPVVMRTRIFGAIRGSVTLPIVGKGDDARVRWSSKMTFPGLHAGESLHRTTEMPPRASLLTRDRKVLAQGSQRTPEAGLETIASNVVGQVGPPSEERKKQLEKLGIPTDTPVGNTGLERIFDDRLQGTPGGRLTAGGRTLAHAPARRGKDVRTTISPYVENAAITALGSKVGGIVAMKPHSGEILAFAGVPFSSQQPPGSTFKIVTLAAALESGTATAHTEYPYATEARIGGIIANANGESCGGTLSLAFAVSCNSVFAPLGVQVGAEKLVETAEAFGFNAPIGVTGAAMSTIPQAGDIGDSLAVGSTAIGQGKVQATTLQMTSIAATIANGGRRPDLTLDADADNRPGARAISAKTAATINRLMIGVIERGTGFRAAIDGVEVAGKTGTAELKTSVPCTTPPPGTTATTATTTQCSSDSQADDPSDTDAWFVSFAPAKKPRVAVGVMLYGAGAGGDTAAPLARDVLAAALDSTG